jgi:hypothetical protein
MIISNSVARIVATNNLPRARIRELEILLDAQTREAERLIIENRVLWDLLLLDPVEINVSEEC